MTDVRVGSSALAGFVRDRSRRREESKDIGDNGPTLLPFDLNQQH